MSSNVGVDQEFDALIRELQKGDRAPSDDEPNSHVFDHIPSELDMLKFERGRQFFIKNVSGCVRGMFLSLVIGLSLDRFLDVLIATGNSSTPKTAFKRYLKTLIEILKWHYGDIWNPNSAAGKAIIYVRHRHNIARHFMEHRGDNKTDDASVAVRDRNNMKVYLSQYDMSLVQSGFIGIIVLYPDRCGIKCTRSELDDYVYVWRWIGYLLGIEDHNNICLGGYDMAYRYCKAIQMEIVLPALREPPLQYQQMANAFLTGIAINSYHIIQFRLYPIIGLAFRASERPIPFKVTLVDRLYMLADYILTNVMIHIPGFTRLLNHVFIKVLEWRTQIKFGHL